MTRAPAGPSHAALIDGLCRVLGPDTERIETHISWLLLSGEHAYKLKKPLTLDFLDFGTLAQRRTACAEELRINRRTAPDIYLGVLPITGTPAAPRLGGDAAQAIDWAVHMRRFPAGALLALRACLSTLETKPWSRFFGALGRMRKSSSRRLVMAALSESCGVSGRAKHADMPASARATRHKQHGGEAASCRATPTCRLALRADRCRTLLSCLPPLPLAGAPGSGGPVALLREQPARRRTRTRPQAGRVRGKTPARWTAAPEAARSAVPNAKYWHPHCTRDDTATASRTTRPIAR